ncbi:MAG TPA: hypothetical protein VFX51_30055 [Solirubrobacteraceae bacterium]|nr:hypothetical protein [Solirubrobacteraceae bacterium]
MGPEHAARSEQAEQEAPQALTHAPGPVASPARLDTRAVLAMQGAAGNAAVTSLLARQPLPPPPAPPPPAPAALIAKAHGGDKAGFLQDLRALAGHNAGDAGIRGAIDTLRQDGTLTPGETLRAVALLELGNERDWPQPVKNFAAGVDGGQFALGGGLPPAGANDLRQFCIERAEAAAEGGLNAPGAAAAPAADIKRDYRIRFDARWDLPRFAARKIEFDEKIASKGPRNERAKAIFDELYAAEPALKAAYDGNTGGVRELCDTYVHPEGANVGASPKIQALRALFNGPQIVANGTAHAGYTAFLATVVPVAQPLEANDRDYIENSRAWRGIIERKVRGTTDAITRVLFEHMKSSILNAFPPAPAAGGAAPPPPLPAPGPVVAPNAAQQAFLASITFTGMTTPLHVNKAEQALKYEIRSPKPNPGLDVRRHVIVEPAAKVKDGQDDEKAWAPGASAVDHVAKVKVDAGGAGGTDYTARLRMEGVPPAAFPERVVTTRVQDDRQIWFVSTVKPGLQVTLENQSTLFAPGTALHYFGGQLPIRVRPSLPAANPGLTIFMTGTLKRGATTIANYPAIPFGQGQSRLLGSTIVRPPTPVPAGSDHLELTIDFFPDQAMAGARLHQLVLPFDVDPALPVAPGGDAALVAADNTQLNLPRATPGSLREHLSLAPAGSNEQRILAAVEAGKVKVQSTIVRSDSAAFLKGPPAKGDPNTKLAYAIGAVSPARTLVGVPNAVGWHTSSFPDHVFLNLTPNSHNPAVKRPIPSLATFLVHEGIHALDQVAAAGDTFARYQLEFRAYWVQGLGAGLSDKFDPNLDEKFGPRSKRANKIFQHLYDSPTYPYVKPAYDNNDGGFRDRVDAYLYPDGINLLLSIHLADLRQEIESFTGPGFDGKRAAITARFGVCDVNEKRDIAGNHVWRDLVEKQFPGLAPPVGGGAPTPRADQIKTILGIPL